jgi:hypothetical protein
MQRGKWFSSTNRVRIKNWISHQYGPSVVNMWLRLVTCSLSFPQPNEYWDSHSSHFMRKDVKGSAQPTSKNPPWSNQNVYKNKNIQMGHGYIYIW